MSSVPPSHWQKLWRDDDEGGEETEDGEVATGTDTRGLRWCGCLDTLLFVALRSSDRASK